MNITYNELRINEVNGNVIADLLYDDDLQCGIEFKYDYELENYYLVDCFSVLKGFFDINDGLLFNELNCNRTFIERAFNQLGIGG